MQPEDIKHKLKQFGLTPNKALGQNFFIDEAALTKLADSMALSGENVLEIGSGLGALTGLLCERAKRVIAIEKDAALAKALPGLAAAQNLTVYCGDILHTDMSAIAKEFGGSYQAAGNLPYYITTPIALKLLTATPQPSAITLMVQQEAAERFFAAPGTKQYGAVAVLSALFWNAKRVMTFHPAQYWPQPDVESAALRLTGNGEAVPDGFLAFLNMILMQRRKTLLNNLKSGGYAADTAQNAIAAIGAPPAVRAEALAPAEILRLFRYLTEPPR